MEKLLVLQQETFTLAVTCSRILLKEPPKISRKKVANTVQQNTITPMIKPINCGVISIVVSVDTKAVRLLVCWCCCS